MPTSPERTLRLLNVGFDSAVEGGDARFVQINVDGPSAITARVSSVSGGTVRLCIIRQDRDTSTACNTRNGPVTTVVNEDGSSVWVIQAQGRAEAAPIGTLTITFNAQSPAATLRSFRFNGTSDPARNGYTAEFTAGGNGEIAVRGNFEDNSFNYRLTIQPCSDAACDQTGSGGNFEATTNGSAGTAYTVRVGSTDESTGGGAAFVQSTISWQ